MLSIFTKHIIHFSILLLFLCVLYPCVTMLVRIKGRSWAFKWRHQLFHRCGSGALK